MKKIIVLLGFLVLVAGCSKKSTSPENGSSDGYTLQASQTIDSDGGTLEVEDFKLTVPQGAFDSGAELKLYASSEDKAFDENNASRSFLLEGLPDEFSQPLQVSIKYEGALSNSSFIAVGEEAMVVGSGELEIAYELFSARDSVGYLHCEFPAGEGRKAGAGFNYPWNSAQGNNGRWFQVASHYLWELSLLYGTLETYYSIYIPSGVAMNLTDLVNALDRSYNTFHTMGFDSYGYVYGYYVPKVIVRNLNTEDYCTFKYRNKDRYGYLDINGNKMAPADFDMMKVMIGREIFRVIQFTYDPSFPVMELPDQNDHYWLNQAAVTWCEEKFVPDDEKSNYVPTDFPGNEMAPFHGIHAGIQEGAGDAVERAKNHGRGMSALIKGLAAEYGDGTLEKIYDQIYGGKHPVEAIINSIPDEVITWWPQFLQNYIAGDIYGVTSELFLENRSGEFSTKTQNAITFSDSYSDLSAKLYFIDLDTEGVSDNTGIKFRLDAPTIDPRYVTVMVFTLKDNTLEFHAHAMDSIVIGNVKELAEQGKELVAVVINSNSKSPYTGVSNIDLKVQVVDSYIFRCCFGFIGSMKESSPGEPDEITDGYTFVGCVWPRWTAVLDDTTYEVGWIDDDQYGYLSSGSAKIVLSEDYTTLKKLDLDYTLQKNGESYDVNLSMTDLEMLYDPLYPNSMYYVLGGLEVCDHLTMTKYEHALSTGEIQEYVSGSCDCSVNPPLCLLEVWLFTGEQPLASE